MIDPAQYAGDGRRHFQVDLVGFELDQRIAQRDDVADVLHPASDAGFDNRLTDFGDYDVCRHLFPVQD